MLIHSPSNDNMLIHSPSNDFVGDSLFAEKYVRANCC